MKVSNKIAVIIVLVFCLPFLLAFTAVLSGVLLIFGINSFFFAFCLAIILSGLIVFKLSKLIKKFDNPFLKADLLSEEGLKSVILQNIQKAQRYSSKDNAPNVKVEISRAIKNEHCYKKDHTSAAFVHEDTINSVIWRWRQGRRRPEIIGAFCSKCGLELVAVNTAVSWEADLRCKGCGKSFASMPQTGANARPRSFSQTKKQVALVINNKKAKRHV